MDPPDKGHLSLKDTWFYPVLIICQYTKHCILVSNLVFCHRIGLLRSPTIVVAGSGWGSEEGVVPMSPCFPVM